MFLSQTLTFGQGIDSLTPPPPTYITDSVCIGSSYTFPDSTVLPNITSNVTHTSTLQAANLCDSLVHTTVIAVTAYEHTVYPTVCYGGSYMLPGGYTLTNITGTQVATVFLSAVGGCDSIVTIWINPITVSPTIFQSGSLLVANPINASYQWLDCDNGMAPLPGDTNRIFEPLITGNYAVQVTMNGCSGTSNCRSFLVGIDEKAIKMEVTVSPNPSNGQVTLTMSQPLEDLEIIVTNASGQRIFKAHFPGFRQEIPVQLIGKSGLYIVTVRSADGNIATRKIIKH